MFLGMPIFKTVRGLGLGLALAFSGIIVTLIFATNGEPATASFGAVAGIYGLFLIGSWLFAYRAVKGMEAVIRELDESIRQEPKQARVYAARAESYTILSRDAEARQDIDTAIELGYDAESLNYRLEELKRRR